MRIPLEIPDRRTSDRGGSPTSWGQDRRASTYRVATVLSGPAHGRRGYPPLLAFGKAYDALNACGGQKNP